MKNNGRKETNEVRSLSRMAGSATLGHHSSLTPITQMIAASGAEKERVTSAATDRYTAEEPRIMPKWPFALVVFVIVAAIGIVLSGVVDGGRDEKAAVIAMQEAHSEVTSVQQMTKTTVSVSEAWDMIQADYGDSFEYEELQSAKLISLQCLTEHGTLSSGPLTYLAMKINGEWTAVELTD